MKKSKVVRKYLQRVECPKCNHIGIKQSREHLGLPVTNAVEDSSD